MTFLDDIAELTRKKVIRMIERGETVSAEEHLRNLKIIESWQHDKK